MFVWETHLFTVKASKGCLTSLCTLGAQLIILLMSLGTVMILPLCETAFRTCVSI